MIKNREMIAYKIAYFLWNIKGSNKIEDMIYYSSHLKKFSDDDITLRGAYGPRLRYWVGADQLQEAIDKDKELDDDKNHIKPEGIDQLQKVYEDLKNGIDVTCCQIFDPSVDYEDTKSVPELTSIGFNGSGTTLYVTAFFLKYPNIVDEYFLMMLGYCIASILNFELRDISCYIMDSQELKKLQLTDPKLTNLTPESLWHDIHKLCDWERYMRNHIKIDTVDNEEIDLTRRLELGVKEFIEPITCQFWKDCGYVLVSTALKKYGKTKYEDYIRNSYISNIRCAELKFNLEQWLESKDGKADKS